MAATSNPSRIELYTDSISFEDLVGVIRNYYDLEFLGLTGQSFSGCFGPDSAATLRQFCRANPEFHIVTCVAPGRYVNKYEAGDNLYFLAQGNRNPSLVLNHLLDPEWPITHEDSICSALATIEQIRNRR